eukprot:6479149-Amphidinium_carterae.1
MEQPRPVQPRTRHAVDRSWKESSLRMMQDGVKLWQSVLVQDLSKSTVGALVLSDRQHNRPSSLEECLAATLMGKAPSTVLARARAVKRFTSWADGRGLDVTCVDEGAVFEFSKVLSARGAPTSIQSVVAGLNFAGHVLGWQGAADAASSPRVKGLMQQQLLWRPQANQAAPLTAEQVRTLEQTVMGDGDPAEAIFAGFCLFLLLTRCRWSDGLAASKVEMDSAGEESGYIEATLRHSKMGRRAKMRGWRLPVAGPVRALHGREWFLTWMRLRSEHGLAVLGDDDTFMPAVAPSGGWLKRGMSTQEAQLRLRGLVGKYGCHDGEVKTHSLKTT